VICMYVCISDHFVGSWHCTYVVEVRRRPSTCFSFRGFIIRAIISSAYLSLVLAKNNLSTISRWGKTEQVMRYGT
jgi:hypothetical protein